MNPIVAHMYITSEGFISLHAKPHKTHVLLTWVLCGFRLCSARCLDLLEVVLSCINVNIVILYRCIFPSAPPPISSLLLFLNNNTKTPTTTKNSRNKSQKVFSMKQVHVGMEP